MKRRELARMVKNEINSMVCNGEQAGISSREYLTEKYAFIDDDWRKYCPTPVQIVDAEFDDLTNEERKKLEKIKRKQEELKNEEKPNTNN